MDAWLVSTFQPSCSALVNVGVQILESVFSIILIVHLSVNAVPGDNHLKLKTGHVLVTFNQVENTASKACSLNFSSVISLPLF